MIRFLHHFSLRSLIRQFGALALTAFVFALPAQAQFDGNTYNDLTRNDTNATRARAASGYSGNGSESPDTNVWRANNTLNERNSDNSELSNWNESESSTDTGAYRLRQPTAASQNQGPNRDQPEPRDAQPRREPYIPSEFERYVQLQTKAPRGREIKRFGWNLMADPAWSSVIQDPLPLIPADYIIRAGDEVKLSIWGTLDADLRLTVDRGGNITVPRIGAIQIAGLKSADLTKDLTKRVGQTFKNFKLSATLGQVRPIRVFVSGYAERPGSVTVNGMASVLHAIMRAGGPSAAGSFRNIHLQRAGREIAVFDLYDLLLQGSRNTDQLVAPDDVIFIGPVGTQVAALGSLNQQAIFELKTGEKLNDLLRMAGGFNAVADRSRVTIERLADRSNGRITELRLPAHANDILGTGDIVRAFSAVTATLPKERQNKRVHIEGEVARPGDYVLPPGSRLVDALALAGGLTPQAYPYGTEFTRESVRQTQQVNYDRALRDLETDMTKNQASQRATSSEEITAQSAAASSNSRLIDRLRAIKPTGRVVLQVTPNATSLPDFALEDGDTLSIPSRGTSVGVFGSVFSTGSFVFIPNQTIDDYLRLAGGPTRGADKDSIFMVRANGSVMSASQDDGFWHSSSSFGTTVIEPGDTIFVPEKINKVSFVQNAKDWTQILYQFGLGLAGIKSLGL